MPVIKKIGLAKKKRRIALAKKAGVVTLITFVLVAASIFIFRRPEFNISEIRVTGTNVLRPTEIERITREKMSSDYLWFLPKSSSFFYPKLKITEDLKDRFKRIETIEVKRDGLNVLVIKLSERPEHYLWCGRDFISERTQEDNCFFIDSGGYVFSLAPYYSGNLFLEFYGPLSSGINSNPLGGSVLPEEEFHRTLAFVSALSDIDSETSPIKVLIKPDGDLEVYLLGGGKVMTSLKNDLGKNLEYLRLALYTEPLKSKIELARENLEYLDIRFGNKVFYKFR